MLDVLKAVNTLSIHSRCKVKSSYPWFYPHGNLIDNVGIPLNVTMASIPQGQCVGIKAMQSCAACEVIIKHNLTSVCRINDIQWWNNCGKWNLNGLVNIVRAREVVIIKSLLRNKVYSTVILCSAVHWQFNGIINCLSALSITDERLWLLPFAWRSFHNWEWNSMLSWGTKYMLN